MTFDTRAGLVDEVLAMLNRETDTDLKARVPSWIQLCEAVIRRQQMWFNQFYSLANSGNPLPITAYPQELPAYVRDVKALWNASALAFGEIEVLTPSAFRSYVALNGNAISGPPRKATIVPQMDSWLVDPDGSGGTVEHGAQLYLWPRPVTDGTVLVDLEYIRDLDPVTDTVVNGLFIRHPDLYFYGTLIESAPFLQHDERAPTWKARFDQAMNEINIERERASFAASRKRPTLPRKF